MKKSQVLIIAFLVLLSMGAFSSLQAKGQDLFVGVSPGGATLDVLQSVTFGASAVGGSGTYTSYQWYVNSAPEGDGSSSFTLSADSAGSYSVSVMVTDDSGASAQSGAASVTVNEDPFVTIVPAGSLTLPAGQAQTFTATVIGGSSPFYYQWYLDGGRVGFNGASYSYSAEGYSHSVTCVVTDSAATPFISQSSNAVTIMVGSAPTEAPTPYPSGMLTPAPSSPMLTPAPSTAQTPSSSMLTPAPSSANPTFILTPAPTTSAPASIFGTVDLLIVVIVVIVVLFPVLFVWQGRRHRRPGHGAKMQSSQTPPPDLGESELINKENAVSETAAVSEEQNDWLEGSQGDSIGEFGDEEISEIQIAPKSLDALKKHGSVYILTDIRNPQYSYRKIKGYDAKLAVEFKEFVEVRKTNVEGSQTELSTETFNVSSPIDSKQKDLGYYVGKSGFSSVEDWVKTLKIEDEVPEGETVSKMFYLYYIH